MKTVNVLISIKTVFTILLVILGLYVLSHITDIVILLALAFIVMTAVHPLVRRLMLLKFPKVVAILSIYLMLIGSLVIMGAVVIPPLVDQTTKLMTQFEIPSHPILKDLTTLSISAEQITQLLSTYGQSVGAVVSVVSSTFTLLFSLVTVIVLSLYLLIDHDNLPSYLSFLFASNDKRERAKAAFAAVQERLGSWVRGQVALMVVIGVMTYIGLTLLGIPYALPLAILAGMLEVLPNLGPTIAAVPAVVIAGIFVSPLMAGITTILYILIQQVENNLIVPKIMKDAVGIKPLVSILLILVGVRFGGVMGALLIIPAYITLMTFLKHMRPEIEALSQGAE